VLKALEGGESGGFSTNLPLSAAKAAFMDWNFGAKSSSIQDMRL
jgi:hypothetical protein